VLNAAQQKQANTVKHEEQEIKQANEEHKESAAKTAKRLNEEMKLREIQELKKQHTRVLEHHAAHMSHVKRFKQSPAYIKEQKKKLRLAKMLRAQESRFKHKRDVISKVQLGDAHFQKDELGYLGPPTQRPTFHDNTEGGYVGLPNHIMSNGGGGE
jgi:hypothetical protein